MADQERSDFNAVFTMTLGALKLLEVLITSLPVLIWALKQKLVHSEAI